MAPPSLRSGARRAARCLATAAAALAGLAVLLILLVRIFTPHRCFLDVLNAQVARTCTFRPFYAASDRRWGLPTPGEVVPGLEALDRNYATIRREMRAAVFGAGGPGRLPPMHEVYNNIFLYKGSEARPPAGPVARAARAATRAAARLVYGPDTGVFDAIGSADWRTYNLLLFHRPVPGNAEACPETLRLLQGVPGVQSALFSVVAPGAYIPPHRDPAKGVIRYHLALQVPRSGDCFIEVDCAAGPGCAAPAARHRYSWVAGESVLFDDVYPHWVKNDTAETRVILFVDVLRPGLTGAAWALQRAADAANYYHPGVRRLARASRVA